jgi:hypothetical protein
MPSASASSMKASSPVEVDVIGGPRPRPHGPRPRRHGTSPTSSGISSASSAISSTLSPHLVEKRLHASFRGVKAGWAMIRKRDGGGGARRAACPWLACPRQVYPRARSQADVGAGDSAVSAPRASRLGRFALRSPM